MKTQPLNFSEYKLKRLSAPKTVLTAIREKDTRNIMRSLNGQDRPQAEQKPQRNNVLTAGQRFSVRVALATGATLAALMGVQTLALQEQNLYAADTSASSVTTSQIVTTSDDQTDEVAIVVSNPSTVIEATATTAPVVVQATAQPTTAVTVNTTTSSQPQPSTRSSR